MSTHERVLIPSASLSKHRLPSLYPFCTLRMFLLMCLRVSRGAPVSLLTYYTPSHPIASHRMVPYAQIGRSNVPIPYEQHAISDLAERGACTFLLLFRFPVITHKHTSSTYILYIYICRHTYIHSLLAVSLWFHATKLQSSYCTGPVS